MLVDVIVPTKNRPELTAVAVNSVLAQTHVELRVLIVDDASDKACRKQLEALAASDGRASVFVRAKSGGPQAARQTGLEHSAADLIGTLDSDDYWKTEKLAAQVALFRENPDIDVALTWHAWERDSVLSAPRMPRPSSPPSPLLTDNMSSPLFHRSSLKAAGGFLPASIRSPLEGSEHIEFWIRLLQHCEVGVVPSVLTICRAHSGPRESDALAGREAGDSLAYVLQIHSEYLDSFPSERAQLLARTGARFLAAGCKREGMGFMRAAVFAAPSGPERMKLLRKHAPHSLKMMLR